MRINKLHVQVTLNGLINLYTSYPSTWSAQTKNQECHSSSVLFERKKYVELCWKKCTGENKTSENDATVEAKEMKAAGITHKISMEENYFTAWFKTDTNSRDEAPNQINYGSCDGKDKQEVRDTEYNKC
jgi:hypothetical protein